MDRYLNTIQLIIKSRKYTFGETLLNKLLTKQVYLVVYASDASENTIKKIKDKCSFYKIDCISFLNKDEIYKLFNKNISYFGILDINLAKKLLNNLKLGGHEYETNIQ